jgi:DNA-binding Xre family transcriptional regulator
MTYADVTDIMKRELRQVDYARKYGVTNQAIYLLWKGKNWAL